MSDADEITALVHSYARLLDDGDVDAVAALFEHSTWRSLPQRVDVAGQPRQSGRSTSSCWPRTLRSTRSTSSPT